MSKDDSERPVSKWLVTIDDYTVKANLLHTPPKGFDIDSGVFKTHAEFYMLDFWCIVEALLWPTH